MFVFPTKDNIYRWDSFIMIKEGFYESAIFRFIIEFSEEFPKKLPTIRFTNKVYHPLINEEGLLDLEYLFPNWKLEIGK